MIYICDLCDAEEENLTHVLLHCHVFQEQRKKLLEIKQLCKENLNSVTGKFLFSKENTDEKKVAI